MQNDKRPGLEEKRADSELDGVTVAPEEQTGSEESEMVYPEGGTDAWLTVLGAFLINFCGFGYTTAFGVYQDFYVREYLSQSSPSAISWIGSVNALLGVSLSLVSGPMYDRGHIRSVIYTGCLLQAFSLFMLSLCKPQQLYQILLTQGIGLGTGLGIVYVPTVAVVSHYFQRRRSLVMALTQAGTPLGALVHPILLNNLLPIPNATGTHRLSFAGATRVSAALGTVLLLVGCLLVKPRKGMHSGTPIFFLQLDATTHGIGDTFAFYVVRIPLYCRSAFDPQTLLQLVIMNASGLVGRLSAGFLAEFFGVALVVTSATAVGTLLIFSMILLRTIASVVVLAVLGGYFIGTLFICRCCPPPIAHSIRLRMGLSFTIEGLGGLVGPPICGALLTSRFIWWRPTLFSGIMGLVGSTLFVAATILVRRKQLRSMA
ncbi:major facilitator superfamily domain-containing protein [Mycena amicta]|nr:major facilitator superfamily domain-containing protein [Mycena amicta]